MWKLLSLAQKLGTFSASNASSSCAALIVAGVLFYMQANGFDFTSVAQGFGVTVDAFIIGAAWASDILFTELTIKFPKLGEYGNSLKTTILRVLGKIPRVYPADYGKAEKVASTTNLNKKE